MKIGELSEHSGCSIQTIRYYEKEKLLSPPMRSEGNFRLYDKNSLEELLFIKQCRNLDMTLLEIKQLIDLKNAPLSNCDSVTNLIENHINQVNQKIIDLNKLKSNLLMLKQECHSNSTVEECGILKKLEV